MRKLAAWCHDRRRTVIGLWVAAFVLCAALWVAAAGEYVNNFRLPGTESQRAYDLLKERFPQQSGDTASVVFAVDKGRVLDAGNRPQIERVRAEIKKSPEVLAVGDPFARGAPVSKDGTITFAQIQFRKGAGDVDATKVKTMAEDTLALDGKGGVQVALGGDIIHWSTAEQGGAGEIFGILVAALVLFLTLGVVAMGLPLLNALFAMVVSLSLMAVVGTRLLDVVDWAPQLAAMIGIGVGIDYALLILNRFRLERGAGRDVREATLVAIDTSGRAVLFAGVVVVIAMLGMMLLGISFLYGPAIARRARGALHDDRRADADAGAAEQDRRPRQAGGERQRRRPRPGRSRDRLRRALERLRGAPAAAGGRARARRADRAGAARAPHAAGDERRQHVQEGRHHADRLRPAQAGLRARLQRPAAARDRAAEGGRPGGARSRSATRCASRTGSRRSCRRSSTSAATPRR